MSFYTIICKYVNTSKIRKIHYENPRKIAEKKSEQASMKSYCMTRLRFLVACLVPFLCMFSITLVQTNIIFAMDGMINHTYVDWPQPELRRHIHSVDHVDVCTSVSMIYFLCLIIF